MNEKTQRELQSYTLNRGFFLFGLKKTERLARAIYLITNFFSDSEPLKWKLRRENLELLENFSTLSGSADAPASVDLSFLENQLLSVLASLGVAYTAGLVSEMNYSIVRHEYEDLLGALRGELDSDNKHSPLMFPKEFFDVGERAQSTERLLFSTSFGKRELTAGDNASADTDGERKERTVPEREAAVTKTAQTDNATLKDTSRTATPKKTKANRREIILTLIKDRKEVAVKDIAREIRDVSEKTLQRELGALVKDNVVEKVGKKRWSRYRLRVE